MYMRVVTSLLAVVGAWIAVELMLLTHVAGRQQSTAAADRARAVGGMAVNTLGSPDESDEVLDRVIHAVEIPRMSLARALDEFSKQAGVRLTVWSGAQAVPTDDQVEVHLSDVTIRDALSAMLRQVKPTPPFCAVGRLVVIGAAKLETRLYDLRPLLPWNGAAGAPAAIADRDFLAERLVNLITRTIAPEEWRDNGGKGSVAQWNGMLVVHQTPRVQKQIAGLLTELTIPQFTEPAVRDRLNRPSSLGATRALRPASGPSAGAGPANDAPDAILDRMVAWVDISSPLKQITIDRTSPLADALAAFSKQAGVKIVVPPGALSASQVGTPIEVHLHDVSVADALAALLRQINPPPAYSVSGKTIVVGSEGDAYQNIYDVRHLLVGPLPGGTKAASVEVIADNLTQLIVQFVDPASWAETGGKGRIQYWNGMLLIEQTAQVHHDVARFLEKVSQGNAVPGGSPRRASAPQ